MKASREKEQGWLNAAATEDMLLVHAISVWQSNIT